MTNIEDIQNWRSGLPIFANWNVVGFSTKWHVDQIRNGHRILPSIFLPINGTKIADGSGWNTCNDAATIKKFVTSVQADIAYLRDNNLPFCLRTDNLVDNFNQPKYKIANDPASRARTFYNTPSGVKQGVTIDGLGDTQVWVDEGKILGQSSAISTIAAIYPNPPHIQFIENNESVYEAYEAYASGAKVWWPLNKVYGMSVRMADYIKANPTVTPVQYGVKFYNDRAVKYKAFYDAYDANLPAGWKGKTYTAAYAASMMDNAMFPMAAPPTSVVGYAPEALSYDATSKSWYISQGKYSDFTNINHMQAMNQIVAWNWLEQRNPKHHREFSILVTNGGALGGVKAGKHNVITPALFEGWTQWLLWATRDKGIPTVLRHWTSSTTKPTDLFFSQTVSATAPSGTLSDKDYLASIGMSSLNTLTQGDYIEAAMTAIDNICNDQTTRNFWLNGNPVFSTAKSPTDTIISKLHGQVFPQGTEPRTYFRMLVCDVNTPPGQWLWNGKTNSVDGVIKVWAIATAIGTSVLLYAWTPCSLQGTKVKVTVPGFSTYTIDAPAPWAYYTIDTVTGVVTQLPIKTQLR